MNRHLAKSLVLILIVGMSLEKTLDWAAGADEATSKSVKWAPTGDPKPLSENVKKGLAWLVQTQHPTGGWGQGEESANMGAPAGNIKDVPNVADTCAATLALVRAGSTPSRGEHAEYIRRGVEFVCGQIEESDSSDLFITKMRGTRLQSKLGTYIDTFLATLLLSEVKDQMPTAAGNARVEDALIKVMNKIEKNQRPDGTWSNEGWAPALQQAIATKGLNRAAQAGADVDEGVRGKAEDRAMDQFDEKKRDVSDAGSAGVKLYAVAANLGAMQDSDNTNSVLEKELRERADHAEDPKEREEAKNRLAGFEQARDELKAAKSSTIERLNDQRFIAGFGSNGGEEFLSYMNIGESLVVDGGEAWRKWDESMTASLNRIQNPDGSWTGHHCVTGRSFCTSTALLVLTVDRAPVPLAAKMGRRS